MKIIHTSDWHLGHELYNYHREDEFECFFKQLRTIIHEQQPEALIVSGDVYDSSVPSVATQTLYTETMLSLHEACPSMDIVVTAGNHDSASRLEIDQSLWRHFHVHVIGGLSRQEGTVCLDNHIIDIHGKGWVVAVPHVFRQNFPSTDDASSDRQTAFFVRLMQRMDDLNKECQRPVVLSAHLAVDDHPGVMAPHIVGGMEYSPLSTLGTGYDYAALGHLHRPHFVDRDKTMVRYCGAPLPITFNEEYEHSVTVAEVHHGCPAEVRVIPIQLKRQVRTIPEQPVSLEESLAMLAAFPADDTSYIRLHVKSADGLPPDFNELALKAAEGKACRFCTYLLEDEGQRTMQNQLVDITPDELREMGPLEVTRQYLEGKGIPPEEYLEMMAETIRQIEMEEAQ